MKVHCLFAFCLLLGACTFNPHGGDVDFGNSDLSIPDNADMPRGDGDGGTNVDMPGAVCVANATSCLDANTLQTCNASGSVQTSTMCPLGCGTDGGAAHCKIMIPTAPVKASDLDDSDLTAPAPFTAAKLVFDVSTGQIIDAANSTPAVRVANTTSAREVHQGIAFHVSNNVAIWSFKGLSVPMTTTIVFDNSVANNAVALVSTTDATIAGTVDARGYESATSTTVCTGTNGGPGGTAGATLGIAATGAGAGGAAAAPASGGGGGGFGAVGAAGGSETTSNGGAIAGAADLAPITGGFGGGFGGVNGGGGGGGVQLVVDGGLTIAATGIINAGGCGGAPGAIFGIGGGGGGSGGAILGEAFSIDIAGTAFVVANGGGGGGGDVTSTAGAAGAAQLNPLPNGTSGASGNSGGNGGAKAAAKPGDDGTATAPGAGGGGGGVGRIRLNTQTGMASVTGTPLSPSLGSGQATQGTIATK